MQSKHKHTHTQIEVHALCHLCFQLDEGWLFGNVFDDDRKTHPLLKPFHLLDERVRDFLN